MSDDHDWRYFALTEYSGGIVDICHRIAGLHEYKTESGESVWAVMQAGYNLDSEITRETAWQIASTQESLTVARHDLIGCEWFIWDCEDKDWRQVEAEQNPLNIPEHF